MAQLLWREPWWAKRPQPGQSDLDVEWGYLERYDDGQFVFNPSQPTLQEIKNRKSCRLPITEEKTGA
ncbi:MAG: hypothetical protein ACLGID_15570 [Gammaproteobacteria bacterium]|jgi:hypothetical protein|uniref:hypothetical protein n=1 Tax=Pseudomonas TaxID=286 RepID=UPI000854375B|nr:MULTISPECIES: hypothetical protein [Pseudomonas]OEO25158.1 hypothetical protein AX279_13805 [Pseudomonas sp. J237]HBO1427584.1 hypothetical protein [Pseudomonas aeruginosa]